MKTLKSLLTEIGFCSLIDSRCLVPFVLLVFVSGCRNSNERSKNTIKIEITRHEFVDYTLTVDSLSFPPEYYQINDFFTHNGENIFAGYNYKTHAIDFFSLTNGTISKHLILNSDGPDKINGVISLKVMSPDSILLADNLGGFSIVDTLGNVIWKILRGDPRVFEKIPKGDLSASSIDFQPGYLRYANSIVLRFLPSDRDEVFELPLLVKIGIKDLEAALLPIYHPAYHKKGYRPQYSGPQACYTDEKIVINYSFSSEIHVYDLLSDSGITIAGESRITDNYLPPMGENDSPENYYLESIYFFRLTYDPYRDLYYRPHWGEMSAGDGGYTTEAFYDKPVYLTVFDKDFNYIYETKLEIKNGIVPYQLFPLPEGLLVFPYRQEPEDLLADRLKGYIIKFVAPTR